MGTVRCQHKDHLPPMSGGTLVLVETIVENDNMVAVYEYTCPGCGQKTRSSHVTEFKKPDQPEAGSAP